MTEEGGAVMSFLIRPARAGDENAIAEQLVKIHDLHAQGRPDLFAGGAPKCDAAKVRALFDDPQTPVLVAETEEGRVVGYLFAVVRKNQNPVFSDFTSLYIDDLFVEKAYRRQSIAAALMKEAEALAARAGCLNITLNVWQFNEGAMAFYRSVGFLPQRTIMEKKLRQD